MMGTYVSISLRQEQLPFSQLAFARLKQVEKALSSYDPQAQIYRLNHQGHVDISKDSYEALALCRGYYKKTEGYFDISIGSVTKGLFHFGEDENIPSDKELLEAKVDFKGLHFDSQRAWIDEGIQIDLGGMGKGFGVDKAKILLKEQGVREGIIALSGDIFCFHSCLMAIQNPFEEGLVAEFSMGQNETSVSTSGNYRRYVKSRDYNHLINPKSGHSQKNFASITLVSQVYSNSDLDAYATAASVMPKAKAFSFLKQYRDIGYLIITNEKEVFMNEGFRRLTKDLRLYSLEWQKEREYIKARPLIFQNSKKPRL